MKTLLVACLALAAGCAAETQYIYGTKVVDNQENRDIIATCEQYRTAVEKKDTAALLGLASPKYWEDGGTPTGADDYGIDGLKQVLETRFARSDGIRYSMKYMDVRKLTGHRAAVAVMIDATYSISTQQGPRRLDMRDQNQLVLEYDGRRWLFLSGM